MRLVKRVLWAFVLAMPFLILNAKTVRAADDYVPEVTNRVARISFISGTAQIKRAEQTDWERATQNLPIVEGDEIATDANTRLEIQFNSETYLRLSENGYLKITTLRDEGIAVSLPNGSLSVRLLNFDKDRTYFEIDAPQTTVAVEKSGMYRVDAGNKTDQTIRVAVTDSGQAKIYTETSGFTLRNGRSATVQLDGDYAGEWQTADAAKYADRFDEWALERDSIVAERLKDAYYDKYYDRDIYGAEELSDFGEWVYTKKYGYVWKPFRTSISAYSDWSPYRYGQWRWIPAYGWTWVNDEPWGWATYHHGRWVWDNNYWYWSPYSQYRSRRSWWQPALVFIGYVGSNVCWYPLPYDYGYYNYNSYYYVDRRRYNTTIINNTTVIVNPTPTPAPTPTVVVGAVLSPGKPNTKTIPPDALLPPSGVVTVEASGFGTGKANFRTAPVDLARKALAISPDDATVKAPLLPTFKQLNGNVSGEIVRNAPPRVKNEAIIETGAIKRVNGIPTGENLRKERILGNRPPIENGSPRVNNGAPNETVSPIRNTGAVKRQPRIESNSDGTPIQTPSNNDGGVRNTNTNPIRETGGNNNVENQPIRKPRIRSEDQQISAPPVYNPPPPQRETRVESPRQPRRERQEAPIRQEPPQQEQPRPQAPSRPEPRPQTPPRQEPPPAKSDPPAEKPAAPNSETRVNRKDGGR